MNRTFALSLAAAATCAVLGAQTPSGLPADALKGLPLRSIGPDITTGRISDIDIDPKNPNVWYVASASGGLFKTENRGNTFTPIFDQAGRVLAGRGRRRSEELGRRLAGHGREQQPAQRRVRRRRLQVDRRRQDLEAHGARALRAHPEHRHRSAQLERRLRQRRSARCGPRAATAASTRRPTAARRGRRC